MIEAFGASDVGCVRELNEDSFCVHVFDEAKEKGFFLIADGMGGHNAGEVASQNVATFIADMLQKEICEKSTEEVPLILRRAIDGANEYVFKMSTESRAHSGMGTTIVTAVVSGKNLYIANVGDSRAYCVHKNTISQLTVDHSVVAELVMSGTITKEEARCHPQKNIITRAVGTDAYVDVDVFEHKCSKGDILLLCSDGLCSMIDDDNIYKIIKDGKSSEDTVCKLIDAAKMSGGLDNITVICIRFV